MPAVSIAQRRLMAAAEHGADFPAAKRLRESMSRTQLRDFASTSEHGLPRHSPALHGLKRALKGQP